MMVFNVDKKMMSWLFFLILITLFSFSVLSFAKNVTGAYGADQARVALIDNNTTVTIKNIKGYPGYSVTYPVIITNYQDDIVSEINERYSIYLRKKYSDNIPLEIKLCEDKNCDNLIYLDEENAYYSNDFYFEASKKGKKTVYLNILWPENYDSYNYSYEIDYIDMEVNLIQVD